MQNPNEHPRSSPVRFLLACGQNPEDLGIEDENGNWDMDRFMRHLAKCYACCGAADLILSAVAAIEVCEWVHFQTN